MSQCTKTRDCPWCGTTFCIPAPPSHRKTYCSKDCYNESIKARQAKFREKYRQERETMNELEIFLKRHPVQDPENEDALFENQMNFLKFMFKINPMAMKDFYQYLKM